MSLRISTTTQYLRSQDSVNSLQARISTLEQQISTGKRSDVFSGYRGEDARSLIDFQGLLDTKESYKDTIDTTNLRIRTVDSVLTRMTDIASEMRVELINQTEGLYESTYPTIRTFAENAITRFTNLLNTKVDGRYIFNGHDTATAPALDPANVAYALTAGFDTNPMDSTNIQNTTNTFFATQTNYLEATPGTGETTVRVDDGVDIGYGQLASDAAFSDVLEVLYAFANADFQPGDDEEYYDLIHNWGLPQIEQAFDDINEMVGDNGVKMRQMAEIREDHEDFITLTELQIIDIEDVDQFEAISRLQALQSQLQGTYQAAASLRQLSLVNFL